MLFLALAKCIRLNASIKVTQILFHIYKTCDQKANKRVKQKWIKQKPRRKCREIKKYNCRKKYQIQKYKKSITFNYRKEY